MKLNKIEKIVIVVILLGIILVGGGFIFVMPSFEAIGKNSKTLAANLLEKAELDETLSRLDTIDADIDAQKKDALKLEGGFYPDLTTYEASEIAMAYMKSAGLEAHTVNISPISTKELKLESYSPSTVEYDLKTYGDAAKNTDITEGSGEAEAASGGSFVDGNKTYSITISNINDVTISDENGNVIAPAKYTDKMKKVYKANVCSLAAAENTVQVVACTSVTYEVKGKAKDYLNFIDHMYSLGRATAFEGVNFPMTTTIQEDKDSENVYIGEDGSLSQGDEANGREVVVDDDTEIKESVTLLFMSVEPMNALKTIDADGTNVVVDQRPAVY